MISTVQTFSSNQQDTNLRFEDKRGHIKGSSKHSLSYESQAYLPENMYATENNFNYQNVFMQSTSVNYN